MGDHQGIALIISVNADPPTRTLHGSAKMARELFERQGLEVLEVNGKIANGAGVYSSLLPIQGTGRKIACAFIIAHGSNLALYGYDGLPIYESTMAPFFDGAIVVANACGGDGNLLHAMSLTATAVLGYKPKLRVYVDSKVSRAKQVLGITTVQEQQLRCLLRPLEKILGGGTAHQAFIAMKAAWRTLVVNARQIDPAAATALSLNEDAVCIWGVRAAKLKSTSATSS